MFNKIVIVLLALCLTQFLWAQENENAAVEALANELQVGETGQYRKLIKKDNPKGLVIIYDPPISVLIEGAEEINRAPLKESQLKGLRARGRAKAVPPDVAATMLASRGGVE